MLNLSLSGCGFLGIYHVGVISAFKEHGDRCFLEKISGCSAGSLVAACALCECCLGKIKKKLKFYFDTISTKSSLTTEIEGQMVSDVLEIAMKARSHALGPLHPSFNIVEILKNGLRRC
jgi:predicted acylesterase/phospholipase RssA